MKAIIEYYAPMIMSPLSKIFKTSKAENCPYLYYSYRHIHSSFMLYIENIIFINIQWQFGCGDE